MTIARDLKRDAEHVDYEIWMLMEASERLRGRVPLPADEPARRALLEAWLLHLRVLFEFFKATRGPDGDDVRAVDYFDNYPINRSKIELLAPAKNSWEDLRVKEIHKALAHIVLDRGRINTKSNEWDLAMVTTRLKTFFDLLDPGKRLWFPRASRWFADRSS